MKKYTPKDVVFELREEIDEIHLHLERMLNNLQKISKLLLTLYDLIPDTEHHEEQ